ncbi:MAG: hypothetical protein NF693_07060, partial [Bombella sp.]|nr:hypothetical protein [Bombella sp.]
ALQVFQGNAEDRELGDIVQQEIDMALIAGFLLFPVMLVQQPQGGFQSRIAEFDAVMIPGCSKLQFFPMGDLPTQGGFQITFPVTSS